VLKKLNVKTVLDVGCGTGKADVKLLEAGYDVTLVDHVENCLLYEDLRRNFILAPAWNIPLQEKHDMLLSIDVLEHIPPELVDAVLSEYARLGKRALFQIAMFSDIWEGVEMHLSIHEADVWIKKIKKHFKTAILVENAGLRITVLCGNEND
jgi:2-polyprenyl-3-methyl-5-hydroxy-6-metoxy-1,4-benzoquinol methylase